MFDSNSDDMIIMLIVIVIIITIIIIIVIRPVRLLRVWVPEGLTQANS